MTLIDVDGAQLWVEEHGSGDEVVLASAMRFSRYPALLAAEPTNCHVYPIQARGFGKSSRVPTPPAEGWLNLWADDVIRVADALGIDQFVYTGVSHGAGIGWHLARRYPERLRALISVVGTPHDRAGDTSSSAGRRKIQANRHDTAVLEEQFRILGGATDTAEQAAIRATTVADAVRATLALDEHEARINQGMPFPEARTNDELAAELSRIDLPVLLLAGLRDGVISPESTLRAARAVRGSTTVLFEDEGHFVATERPERLVPPIATFLGTLHQATAGTSR